MINITQYHDQIYYPVANAMGVDSPERWATLCMISAHESGFGSYVRQAISSGTGYGNACGMQQMEKPAVNQVIKKYSKAELHFNNAFTQSRGWHWREMIAMKSIDQVMDLIKSDLKVSCFFAICYMLDDPKPLPKLDVDLMAQWCKERWNTNAGKASEQKYINDFERHCGGLIECLRVRPHHYDEAQLIGGFGAVD